MSQTGDGVRPRRPPPTSKMMLSATPYDDEDSDGNMGVPLSPALSAGSNSTDDSSRRRTSPSTTAGSRKSLPMQRISRQQRQLTHPTEEEHDDGYYPDIISRTPLHADEGNSTMREMVCNYVIEKPKALVLGQLLAFWLASTGAVQSKLHLDCNLSAPMFSTLSFYVPLSIFCIGLLMRDERRNKLQEYSSPLSDLDDVFSMQQESDHGSGSPNVTNQSSHERSEKVSRISAKPEKRNHLLSRWSECSPTTETAEDHSCHVDGSDEVGSIGDVNSHSFVQSKPYSFFGLTPLRIPKRKYAMVALFDVYAQYTTILAYKYTTNTNVALFDAFAIPSAIVISRCFFGRRYTKVHLVAVLACVVGIALNVLEDYREDEKVATEDVSQESEQEQYIAAEYPHKVAGDALAIIGGILFGISNTLQEVTVKDGSLVEYLGCFTFFASIIAAIQAIFFERQEIMNFYSQSSDETCSKSEGEFLFFLFAVGGIVTYAGIGAFLQLSDAAFFNLSLLTGDAWAVVFSVFAEGIKPPPTFYVALAITLSGVIIYETAPSPVVDSQQQEEDIGDLQLTENDSTRRRDDEIEQDEHVIT